MVIFPDKYYKYAAYIHQVFCFKLKQNIFFNLNKMYGLSSMMMNNYRISNDTSLREKYPVNNKQYNILRTLAIVNELLFTLIVLILLYDIYIVNNLNILLVMFIALLIPIIGDIVGLFVIIYWFIVIRQHSKLFTF